MRRVLAPAALKGALFLLAALVGIALLPDPGSRQHEPVQVSVTRVVDGDTLKVTGMGAEVETVRLIGVDTPETVKPRTPVQCFGPEASTFTKHELPPGSAVQLRFDANAPLRDKYGRVLAYVWEHAGNGPMLNIELLSQGYARASYFRPHDDYRNLFKTVETKAKAAGKGRWAVCGK